MDTQDWQQQIDSRAEEHARREREAARVMELDEQRSDRMIAFLSGMCVGLLIAAILTTMKGAVPMN